MTQNMVPTIVVAGATGNEGLRISSHLLNEGAKVRALVRPGSNQSKLKNLNVEIREVDYSDPDSLTAACDGASCVVSALSGLRPVIVDAQTALVNAAVHAGVARFIPSDYCIDFTKLPAGSNRNLDLRRDFHERLASKNIRVTSIFNGAFADMILKEAPLLFPKIARVLYWEDADVKMDFTTRENTSLYTAKAALDPEAPRYLHIAGDQVSANDLAAIASRVYQKEFKVVRAGSLLTLDRIIKVARAFDSEQESLYPIWQGMQYMRNMFSGLGRPSQLDNDRYPNMDWTTITDILKD